MVTGGKFYLTLKLKAFLNKLLVIVNVFSPHEVLYTSYVEKLPS